MEKSSVAEKVGLHQSPLDLKHSQTMRIQKKIAFHDNWRDIKGNFDACQKTGHCNFEVTSDAFLDFGSHKAKLVKVHFHQDSEHLVDGKIFDGEIHFIHQLLPYENTGDDSIEEPSELLVVGVLMEISQKEDQTASNSLLNFFRRENGASSSELPNDIADKVNKLDEFYYYRGSLTSSPYTEHVTWAVFKDSIPVAKDSIDRIKEAHQHARGPQEWNRRFVLRNFD
ncbi:MAG: carbonic anhydrase family protein [Leptolyngbya sp.]|nr:carbonic anhydrase family protein [Candidatus Melainabacteria bacterium]